MLKIEKKDFRILEFRNNQFDIIGDIHGCYDEFMELLKLLGYEKGKNAYFHPQGRRLISVGDVADKGPQNLRALEFWINQVSYGNGFWVHGNHCNKLYRYFMGRKVSITHGLESTVSEVEQLPEDKRFEFKHRYINCYESQCYYYLLDKKRLAVVHGGLREEFIGRFSNKIKTVCLYGETTGKLDKAGRPERIDWASQYSGKTVIVYGHTVLPKPTVINHTVDIDQGCVYGGSLTALRYPEMEFVQVRGKQYACYGGKKEDIANN